MCVDFIYDLDLILKYLNLYIQCLNRGVMNLNQFFVIVHHFVKYMKLIFFFFDKSLIFELILIIFTTDCAVSPPSPVSNDVNCHISSNCTGISCCLQDHISGTSYQFSIEINPCDEKILITLEKFTFTTSLFDYTMGTKEVAKLFGVLELE